MDIFTDFFNTCCQWFLLHWVQILISIVGVIVAYIVYRFVTREVTKLREAGKLEENVATTLNRAFKWIVGLIILAIIIGQLGIEIGVIFGLFALAGGTIIGFAAMNTIGNAIAGIIIMTSRPFKVGDRIFFKSQFADVTAIDLIYTRMETLDNVLVSVPNQELLKTEIENYQKRRIVRRSCSITAGYDLEANYVEKALLEAANNVKAVLKTPKPYIWITEFQNFAIKYTLYVFVNDVKRLPEIDANLKRSVLEACSRYKIDISTPTLLRSVK